MKTRDEIAASRPSPSLALATTFAASLLALLAFSAAVKSFIGPLSDTKQVGQISIGQPFLKVGVYSPRSKARAKIASLPDATVTSSRAEPGAPVGLLRITSDFGMRLHPILGVVRMHEGVDIGAREGAPVLAAADGIVTDAGFEGGYGNMIHIRHASGWATGYAHLSAFAPGVHAGARVTRGEVIAFVGHTGLATGPHLHFEVSYNGVRVNPMSTALNPVGADSSFRWSELVGQTRAIDLAYRGLPFRGNDVRFSHKTEYVIPVASIGTNGQDLSHLTEDGPIDVQSAAQAQKAVLLARLPELPSSGDQSIFGGRHGSNNNHHTILNTWP